MYEVIFDPDTIEYLKKLDRTVARRIWDKIMSTRSDPHHYFERMVGRNDFKLRIGDYRAIADIDRTSHKIEITLLGHRKKIYKRK